MPDAPAEVRELYRRHARGNSLFRNRGDGTFEDVTLAAGAALGRWAWASDSLDFDNDGNPDLYVVERHVHPPRPRRGRVGRSRQLLLATGRRAVAPDSGRGHALRGRLARDQPRARRRLPGAVTSATSSCATTGSGRFDEVSGSVGLDLDQDGRSFAVFDYDQDGDADLAVMAARSAPQLRLFRNELGNRAASLAVRLTGTKTNRDAVGARVMVATDLLPPHEGRDRRLGLHLAALEGAALWPRREPRW